MNQGTAKSAILSVSSLLLALTGCGDDSDDKKQEVSVVAPQQNPNAQVSSNCLNITGPSTGATPVFYEHMVDGRPGTYHLIQSEQYFSIQQSSTQGGWNESQSSTPFIFRATLDFAANALVQEDQDPDYRMRVDCLSGSETLKGKPVVSAAIPPYLFERQSGVIFNELSIEFRFNHQNRQNQMMMPSPIAQQPQATVPAIAPINPSQVTPLVNLNPSHFSSYMGLKKTLSNRYGADVKFYQRGFNQVEVLILNLNPQPKFGYSSQSSFRFVYEFIPAESQTPAIRSE